MWFLLALVVGVAFQVASFLLMPKPKRQKPEATTEEFKSPTAEAGRPIPVVFGKVWIESPNILGTFDKSVGDYEIED